MDAQLDSDFPPKILREVDVIDMHTHVFNAAYLPLIGIFQSFEIRKYLAKPLAKMCWFLTDYDNYPELQRAIPFHLDKANMHDDVYDQGELQSSRQVSHYVDSLALDCETMIARCLGANVVATKAFDSDPIGSSETALQNASMQDLALSLLYSVKEVFEFKLELESVSVLHMGNYDKTAVDATKGSLTVGNFLRAFLKQVFSPLEKAHDYIDFCWNMSQSERAIYDRIYNFYSEQNINVGFVHYMMDMSHPYSKNYDGKKAGRVKVPFYPGGKTSQLSRMAKLSNYSQQRLIGFSAFDPWRFRDAEDVPAAVIAALDLAQNEFGMRGFKFYPPMNYRADDNEDAGVQQAVISFFNYCLDHKVPVFAHCTPSGFEVEKGSGRNSAPIYWRNFLESSERASKLRLCLGHGGGGRFSDENDELISAGWVSNKTEWSQPGNYAKEVVSLCREFENVYCELANIDSILHNDHDLKNLTKNLTREFTNTSGSYSLCKKIAYGTDWHMVGMVNDAIRYFRHLREIFEIESLSQFERQFFHDNALSFLTR